MIIVFNKLINKIKNMIKNDLYVEQDPYKREEEFVLEEVSSDELKALDESNVKEEINKE